MGRGKLPRASQRLWPRRRSKNIRCTIMHRFRKKSFKYIFSPRGAPQECFPGSAVAFDWPASVSLSVSTDCASFSKVKSNAHSLGGVMGSIAIL